MSAESIPYGPEPSQFFELWRPAGEPRFGIVLIHGGSWLAQHDLSHLAPLCRDLSSRGFLVANLEYRRVGNPGGGWPGTFEDVRTGYEAVRGRFPQLPWLVMGHSAGGHLALWLGGEASSMEAVVALAPVSDLEWPGRPLGKDSSTVGLLGGSPQEIPDIYRAANPARRRALVPQILIHGREDDMVPPAMTQGYAPLGEAAVQRIEVPGDHFELIDPESEAWHRVLELLEQQAALNSRI